MNEQNQNGEKIGKLESVELREVWRHEASDLTPWLFENLEILAEALNFGTLNPEEKEKSVGEFSADIVATDSDGNAVLIENQLERTDHSHLGQILTYVANIGDIKAAVWISKEPRAEHRKAIEWLNETAAGIDFYLVKVEAYRIGDSRPAPKFTVIAGPSEISQIVGGERTNAAKQKMRHREFWSSMLDKARVRVNDLPVKHAVLTPTLNWWINFEVARGLYYSYDIGERTAMVSLAIYDRKPQESMRVYDQLKSHKAEIESDYDGKLHWGRYTKSCRISQKFSIGLNSPDKWDDLHDQMIDAMIRLHRALDKHVQQLPK